MKITTTLYAVPEHWTNWNQYEISCKTGILQSIRCQWMSFWCGRDSCLPWKVYTYSKRVRFGTNCCWGCHCNDSVRNEVYVAFTSSLMANDLLRNQRYHVTKDKWFSSPSVSINICKRQTGAKGTMCQNGIGAWKNTEGQIVDRGNWWSWCQVIISSQMARRWGMWHV